MWKLFKYEMQKIFVKKMFWCLALSLLVGNLCFFGYMEKRTDYSSQESEQQQQYLNSYTSFLGEMEVRSNNMLQVGSFAKEGTFAYRNIVKTNEDYGKLSQQSLKLQEGNTKGVLALSDYTGGAVFALVFSMMCVFFLFLTERDLELICMVKSCKLGRVHTITAKYVVLLFLCFGYGSIQTLTEVIFAGWKEGYGDLTRNLQSVQMYRDCWQNVTVGQFLVQTVFHRGILLMLAGAVTLFLATVIRNTFSVLAVWFACLAVEYLAFKKFTVSSSLHFFHCMNPWYYWDESKVWGEYVNLNLSGHAIGRNQIGIVCYICLLLLVCGIGILAFSNIHQKKRQSRLEEMIFCIRDRIGCIPKTVSIIYYEFYRVMFQQKKIILVVLLACISGMFLDSVLAERWYNDPAVASYHSYLQTIHGKISEDTLQYIQQQEEDIWKLSQELSEIIDAKAGKDYIRKMEIMQELECKEDGFWRVKEQLEQLESKTGRLTDKYLLDEEAYADIWSDYKTDLFSWNLQALAILCVVAGIMSVDSKSRMEHLIYSTPKGREFLAKKRVMLSVFVTVGIYLMVEIPSLLEFYQIDGFVTCQQKMCDMTKWSVNSNMTLGSFLVLLFLLRLCSCLLVCFAAIPMVRIIKSEVIAIVLMGGLVELFVIFMLVFQQNISMLLLGFL